MIKYRYTLVWICIFLSLHQNVAQSILSKDAIINYSSADINQLNFETFSIDDFSRTFDVAVELINDSTNLDYHIKGTNVLGALAKELHLKIKYKRFDLDAENTEILLKKFETQSYYISRPTPSQIIKLMKYTCQGDYPHIYDRFSKSSFFTPTICILVIYLLMLITCIFKKKNKTCSKFIRLSIICLALFVVIMITFKLTCEPNIKDYSFYGISL